MTEIKPKRRWFKFSLRTLFVLVTIIGVGTVYAINLARWMEQRDEFIRTHRMSGSLKQIPPLDVPERIHSGVLRRFSGPVGLEAKESEFAKAKGLFPDAEW
jgi:hypothetical protein